MREAAQLLVGSHDYRNFCKIDPVNVIQFVREIRSAEIQLVQDSTNKPDEKLHALVLTGSGFLWHQVRCIVAILFLIGSGDEEVNIINRLLDVEKYPCKPTYNMAPELPLVLWDCSFDSTEFIYDSQVITRILEGLFDQWKEITVKYAIIRHMINALQGIAEVPNAPGRNKKRKYKALLERPTGPSLEEMISNLSEKQKEKYQAKKRKLEDYAAEKANEE